MENQVKKKLNKLEFDARPQVTRFRNKKTSFWREVVTGSTHPRHVTDWLSKIDQATQDPYSVVLE